jgi:hypothetical protein
MINSTDPSTMRDQRTKCHFFFFVVSFLFIAN